MRLSPSRLWSQDTARAAECWLSGKFFYNTWSGAASPGRHSMPAKPSPIPPLYQGTQPLMGR